MNFSSRSVVCSIVELEQEHLEHFYEEVFLELAKFGEVQGPLIACPFEMGFSCGCGHLLVSAAEVL